MTLLEIKNVVTTADLRQDVDVNRFNKYMWGKYDQETYGGRCGYVRDTKIHGRVSVFFSGKMISLGGRSVKESISQLQHAMELLVSHNFVKRVTLEPKVQNIVATMDIGHKLDINQLALAPESTYEPEQFPGLIYRTHEAVCTVFSSGKLIITGAKSEKQVTEIVAILEKKLETYSTE